MEPGFLYLTDAPRRCGQWALGETRMSRGLGTAPKTCFMTVSYVARLSGLVPGLILFLNKPVLGNSILQAHGQLSLLLEMFLLF